MKKLITILTIMIVLVGAVFAVTNNSNDAQTADGTAQIEITAKVTEQIPQFQLAIASAEADVSDATVSDDVEFGSWSNATPSVLSAGTINAESSALTADAVKALTGNGVTAADVTVSFVINQIAKANLKANYKITVTAGNLNLVEYSDGTAVPTTNYTLKSTEYFEVDDDTPTVTASNTVVVDSINAITFTNTTGTDNVLHLQYTGNAQVDGSSTAVQLGSFNVKWKKNETAVAGDYKATVQIVVLSE